jgi:hypothetical protein
MKMKILFAIVMVLALLLVAAPMVARADGITPPTPPGSEPGIDRYYAILAIADIPSHAQCGSGAGSGAFGYFGKGNSMAGGANGYQTGLNNSAVCGNRP